jgi:hypothetical protein
MTPPRVLLVLDLEAASPHVRVLAANAADEERLALWVARALPRLDLAAPLRHWLEHRRPVRKGPA